MEEFLVQDDFLNKNLSNAGTLYNRLGFFPTSVWTPHNHFAKKYKEIIEDNAQSRKNIGIYKTGWNNGKCSIFNPSLAQMILAAYCPKSAKIYDPFGGGGTRGYIATKMGHEYTGVELRKEEVDRIVSLFNKWGIKFNLICADAITFVPNEKYDFIFSCPPYYNLETYSSLPNDLSGCSSYDVFLDNMTKVIANCYTVLKDNSFACFVVGNFRNKSSELCHFNGDLVNIAKKCGFILWDEIVYYGASKAALTRCGQFIANRKSVRMHEYIIILKKDLTK